jgi:hypothetical protein
MKGRNIGWNFYRECHQKELPRKVYIIRRHEAINPPPPLQEKKLLEM